MRKDAESGTLDLVLHYGDVSCKFECLEFARVHWYAQMRMTDLLQLIPMSMTSSWGWSNPLLPELRTWCVQEITTPNSLTLLSWTGRQTIFWLLFSSTWFIMPLENASPDTLYYSYDFGTVHITNINTVQYFYVSLMDSLCKRSTTFQLEVLRMNGSRKTWKQQARGRLKESWTGLLSWATVEWKK